VTANTRALIFHHISLERERQDDKWGWPQHNNITEWLAILAEEAGEVATEVNECHFRERSTDRLKTELIQVAAVCVSWLEHLEEDEA
jgi:NTP pyrophosphatase (non-canonical NTP hydrolase)